MVGLMVALVVVGAVGLGWRLARYPGGLRYAFSDVHRADRQDLKRTRAAVRTLQGTARQEESQAQIRATQAERAYDRRIDALERKLEQLERPGRGAYDTGLGDLSLYRHVLLFKGKEIPLAGLGVRFDLARNTETMYIHLKRPEGWADLSEYAHETFPEDQVRRFGVRIENAVAAENAFRDLLPEAIRKTGSDLADARADTAEKDGARAALERVRARHSDGPLLAKALAELEAARDRWQRLTGRRPR
ncbi:hypothetical protein [Streptomyces broussonetiae]|uniref:Uncharacterized protein n=1 Tax=Streptomyces broussonetiae TaxID=2686304 RepID=A0A6I6NEE1_9ACTN|nr:hypothetical protein [Streptomyces broussonetiae]QHA08751.1 hypothetical protein GQF42_40725 [Streptomyces broussonetiae]